MKTCHCLDIYWWADEMGFCLSCFSDLQYHDVCATHFPIFCPLGGTAKVVNAIIPHFSDSGCRRESRFIPPKLTHLIKMPELGAWSPVFSGDTTFSQGLLKWWLSPCCPSLVFLQFFFGQRCACIFLGCLLSCWLAGCVSFCTYSLIHIFNYDVSAHGWRVF